MAETVEQILIQVNLDADKVKEAVVATKERVVDFKMQLKAATEELANLQKGGEKNSVAISNQKEKIVEINASYEANRKILNQLQLQLTKTEQANISETGSLAQKRNALAAGQIAYAQYSQEQKATDDTTKAFGASLDVLKQQILDEAKSIGSTVENVGNYEAAINSLSGKFKEAQKSSGEIRLQLLELNKAFNDGKTEKETYTSELAKLNMQLEESANLSKLYSDEINQLKGKADDSAEGIKNLSQQIRDAKNQAELAADSFAKGLISKDDLKNALEGYEELKKKRKEVADAAAATEIEGKLKSITNAAASIAGGFAAAQGAAVLFGSESKNVEALLLKIQAIMAVTSGLKAFAELGDTAKALSLSLGLATTSTLSKAAADGLAAAAEGANAAATGAANVVTGEQVVVQQAAIVSTETLTAALGFLVSPLGLIVVGVGAVVAAYALLNEKDQAAEIEKITIAAKGEANAHSATVDKLNELNSARVSAAENALAVAQAEGKGAEEIKGLQEEVLQAKKIALTQERAENKTHYAELLIIQSEGEAKLREDLSEEERQKTKVILDENAKQIEALRKRNADIAIESAKLSAEKAAQDAKNAEDETVRIEKAASIRVGLIKNNRERELVVEKQALSEQLRQLEKDEIGNSELIGALKEQSLQKQAEINFKYAKQEVDDSNKIRILGTQEGTEARIQAERKAIEASRNIELKEVGLTQSQRNVIIFEAKQKLAKLDEDELKLKQDQDKLFIDAEARKQKAILDVRRNSATSPNEAAAVEFDAIQLGLQQQLAAIEKGNDDQVAQIALKYDQQAALAQGNADKLAEIETNKVNEINAINSAADAEALAAVIQAGKDTADAASQYQNDFLQSLSDFNQLKIAAADSSELNRLELENLQIRKDQEVQHAKDTIQNEEERRKIIQLIDAKYDKIALATQQQRDLRDINNTATAIGAVGALFKKGGIEYRAFASAEALISTYSAATAATAPPPVGLGPLAGLPLAIASVAKGLANIATINGVQFYDGGFTGRGDPRQVSTAVGWRPYTYHNEEHISPAWMVNHPVLAPVYDRLEGIRVSKRVPSSGLSGYADGGFAPGLSFFPSSASAPVYDQIELTNSMVQAVSALPRPIVAVDEINLGQASVQVREARASS